MDLSPVVSRRPGGCRGIGTGASRRDAIPRRLPHRAAGNFGGM